MQLILLTAIAVQSGDHIPPPEVSVKDWDEHRWTEYLARKTQGTAFEVTPVGVMDLRVRGTVFEVAPDTEWRRAISQALLLAAATNKQPGIFLMCPGARTEEYMEAMVVVQHLRSHDLEIEVRTIATPEEE